MKTRILNYTFSAAAKTITFTDYNPVLLEALLIITNATDQIIIFNFADTSLGGTVATNVLTLEYDTTTMSDTDKLLIYYDDSAKTEDTTGQATSAKQDTVITSLQLIDNIVSGTGANISQLGGASTPIGAGLEVTALRVTLPTDGTGVVKLGAGTAEVGKLAAGSAIIGKVSIDQVTANANEVVVKSITAGDNNIGNVDIVSGTITTVSSVTALGTGTTGPMKAEDAAHATGDQGFPAWGVANEANTARAADGDYLPLATDTEGNVRVVGNRDSDAADAGEPVKIGGQARTTNPTAVADADRVNAIFDKLGKQIIALNVPRELTVHQTTTITASTTETTILTAGAASVFHDITEIVIANTSATDVRVDIRDATAGSVIRSFYCPSGNTIGVILTQPMTQTTAANNWTATSSASITDLWIYIAANKVL